MTKNTLTSYFKDNFQADLSAGLVVFLVAIPLCLGIALASGAPLMSGIISGIIGGIVVGIFGGSALGVSGPAAGLVAVVLAAQAKLGTFEALLLATLIAGGLQFILGQLKAGVVAYYIPNVVIKGMLAAIGLIIILKQIPHAFGYDAAPEGELSYQSTDGHNTFSELGYMISNIQPGALIITLVGLALLIAWNTKFLQKFKFFRALPGPLAVVLSGIGLQMVFAGAFPSLAISAEHMVSIPTEGGISELVILPDFSAIINPDVWLYAFIIAAVASIESLLCAEATDKLDPEKRITPMNKELKAQGIGNMVAGLIGGLPVTQVIVRSSANLQSGAKTRGSAIIHGIFILAAILIFPILLNLIPLASLAAILIMVGYKLTKPAIFKKVFAKGWNQFIPFVITIIAIMLTDLLVGIGIGMAVSIFFILRTNFKIPFSYKFEEKDQKQHIRMKLSEIVSFLNKGQILSTLQHIPDGTVLEIDGRKNVYIDPDVREVLQDFIESASHRDIEVEMIGVDEQLHKTSPAKSLKRKLGTTNNEGDKDVDSGISMDKASVANLPSVSS